jgi:hypothetical protein
MAMYMMFRQNVCTRMSASIVWVARIDASAPPVTEPQGVPAPKYEMIWPGLCMANNAKDARCSYGFLKLLRSGVL